MVSDAVAKPLENGTTATPDINEKVDSDNQTTEAAAAEETSAIVESHGDADSEEGAKKPKKEKVKKRWSFRSFSFSKKDKQKPTKKEETPASTNGECEQVPEEVCFNQCFVLYVYITIK